MRGYGFLKATSPQHPHVKTYFMDVLAMTLVVKCFQARYYFLIMVIFF